MRIRDIDFPAELVGAHRDGRLVLFVGAGASIAPPAGHIVPVEVMLERQNVLGRKDNTVGSQLRVMRHSVDHFPTHGKFVRAPTDPGLAATLRASRE